MWSAKTRPSAASLSGRAVGKIQLAAIGIGQIGESRRVSHNRQAVCPSMFSGYIELEEKLKCSWAYLSL